MTEAAERYARLKALFHAARERAAADREAFLLEAEPDDASLREDATQLLASETASDTFLRAPTPPEPSFGSTLSGERSYRLLSEIGSGGMGRVYLAERAEGEFRLRVAIKFSRPGMADAELLKRFRAERQILSRLDHPNIARLLDGGATPDGTPFLVMEYVDGERIDLYCDGNNLDAHRRVNLFVKVCRAVQAAHQNLIVHRDLKPANILVDAQGEPKLLDFGIAKLLGEEALEFTQAETQQGAQILTPRYASPEQVRGDAVTTATDIYGLGVVLYELLTGRSPYALKHTGGPALIRAICDSEPTRPSIATRTSADAMPAPRFDFTRLARDLEGDIDAILLKCLRKEPGSRYSSAAELADDLERYLARLPVRAHRGSAGYRMRKFVARHRLAVGVGLLGLLATVAFIVALQQQLTQVAIERDKARAMSDFLVRMFDASDPESPRARNSAENAHVTVREVIDAFAPRIETDLADQPEVRANMLAVIERVYYGLDQWDLAHRYGNAALQALGETGQIPSEAGVVARLFLLPTLYARGDLKVMFAQADLAIEEARMLQSGDSFLLARALNSRASLFRLLGRADEAERDAVPALEMMRRTQPADSPYVAVALKEVAQLADLRGDYAKCEATAREARAGWPPSLGTLHVYYTLIRSVHAGCLWRLGRYVEAEHEYRDVLAQFVAVRGDDSLSAARASLQLARLLNDQARRPEAQSLLQPTLPVYRREYGDQHPEVGNVLSELGESLADAADMQTPLLHLRGAVQRTTANTASRALAQARLARQLYRIGDATEAGVQWRLALQYYDAHPSARSERLTALSELGAMLSATGKATEAAPLLAEAERLAPVAFPAGHWRIAAISFALGLNRVLLSEDEAGSGQAQQALADLEQSLGKDHPEVRRARSIEAKMREQTSGR